MWGKQDLAVPERRQAKESCLLFFPVIRSQPKYQPLVQIRLSLNYFPFSQKPASDLPGQARLSGWVAEACGPIWGLAGAGQQVVSHN